MAKTDGIGLAATCAVVALLSLVGIVWDITSGLLFNGIDGIMLLLICLMMGGVFSLELILVAKRAGWLDSIGLLHRKQVSTPASAASAAASAASSPAEEQK